MRGERTLCDDGERGKEEWQEDFKEEDI